MIIFLIQLSILNFTVSFVLQKFIIYYNALYHNERTNDEDFISFCSKIGIFYPFNPINIWSSSFLIHSSQDTDTNKTVLRKKIRTLVITTRVLEVLIIIKAIIILVISYLNS